MLKKAMGFLVLAFFSCGPTSDPLPIKKAEPLKLGDVLVTMAATGTTPINQGGFAASMIKVTQKAVAVQESLSRLCQQETIQGCLVTTCAPPPEEFLFDDSWKVWGWEKSSLTIKTQATEARLPPVKPEQYENASVVCALDGGSTSSLWTANESSINVQLEGTRAPLADFNENLPVPGSIKLESIGDNIFRSSKFETELTVNPSQALPLRWNYSGNSEGDVWAQFGFVNKDKKTVTATCRFGVNQGKLATVPPGVMTRLVESETVSLGISVTTDAARKAGTTQLRWTASSVPTFEGKPASSFLVKWPKPN
jgi:hypothetical protein